MIYQNSPSINVGTSKQTREKNQVVCHAQQTRQANNYKLIAVTMATAKTATWKKSRNVKSGIAKTTDNVLTITSNCTAWCKGRRKRRYIISTHAAHCIIVSDASAGESVYICK